MEPSPPETRDGARRTAWRLSWRQVAAVIATLSLLAALGVGVCLNRIAADTPSVFDLHAVRHQRPSVLLAADGSVLTTFRRARQDAVPLDRISPHVVDALLATEDRRFHEHHGVDLRRTAAAAWHSMLGDLQGGSTITQQLARNLFPEEIGRSRSLERKLKELFAARRIEQSMSKTQILEQYLNTVPFLYNAVGIEAAAQTYFGIPAIDLDAAQAATLVGMLKGTHAYNPVRHPERALARRNLVLQQMARHGRLDASSFDAARATPLALDFHPPTDNLGPAPHFAAHAKRWLEDWAEANGHDLFADGLTIESTLDPALQALATKAVTDQAAALQQVADAEWSGAALPPLSSSPAAYKRRAATASFAHLWKAQPRLLEAAIRETAEFRKRVAAGESADAAMAALRADEAWLAGVKARKTRLEAGLVAIDPRNGEVKAWVGSRDFFADQYDHVALAQRQPGSTFKPFVYGAALEEGITPLRPYVDEPVQIALGGGKVWRPTDMSGFTHRTMTMRDGLAFSKNTITAQVMQDVGVPRVASLAKAMGVNLSALDAVPSLALGTSPVTLLEMTSSYATIANQGEYRPPIVVKRILDRDGRPLAGFGGERRRAMSADAAIELTDMLRGVVARGTGTAVRTRFGLQGDLAGKTGTTQHNTDGWFILMHRQLVAGAWVGFNDSRVTMRSSHWGQGGHNAVLLVGDFFRGVQQAKVIDADARFMPSRYGAPLPWPDDATDAEEDAGPWGEADNGTVSPAAPASAPADPMLDAAAPRDPRAQTEAAMAQVQVDQLLDRLSQARGDAKASPSAGAAQAAGEVGEIGGTALAEGVALDDERASAGQDARIDQPAAQQALP